MGVFGPMADGRASGRAEPRTCVAVSKQELEGRQKDKNKRRKGKSNKNRAPMLL